ncbi:7656_t:CDS:2 [Funneliformis geosporum]|nr:7656_t:CDS:2 [Funneliformis geosporum]
MNEPEPEPYVIQLPSMKFKSKGVQLADQAAEESKNVFLNQRNFYEAGIIATAANRPGEDRGQFQRTFDNFMFGCCSVLQDPPVIKSGDHRLKYKSVQELIDSATVSTIDDKNVIPELYEPTSMHSLFNDDTFGKEKSVDIENDYFPQSSSSTEDIKQFNTLKRAHNESANQIESRKRIAGTITTFTNGNFNESKITEEQWFNTIALLDLPKTLIKSTLQALQEKKRFTKIGIIIGQISDVHSTNKVLTLRDHKGLPSFITITLNIIYMLYVDEHNKVLGYVANIHSV